MKRVLNSVSFLVSGSKKKKMPNSYKHSGFEAQERTLTKGMAALSLEMDRPDENHELKHAGL